MYKDNIELIKKIFTLINLPYEEENIEDAFLFLDQYTIYFLNLRDWLEKEDAYLVDNLNKQVDYYNIVAKEINNNSFEEVLDNKISNLKKKYKEMLKYKNKKYDPTLSFKELSTIVSNYYNYYAYNIEISYQAAISNTLYNKRNDYKTNITDIERIILLEDTLNKLDNYQEHAYDYKDFELEDNQTFEDLLDLEDLKYEELYKEILDYHNISYEEGDNYEELATIYYPPLKDILNIVHSASLHSGTYIDILDTMEKYYNRIKEDYKNYH